MAPRREIGTYEDDLHKVCERILEADPQAKVVAEEDILLYLRSLSPQIVPLYTPPVPGKEYLLPEEEHRLLDMFSSQHPDFEELCRICRKEKMFFAVTDRDRMWPEHGFEHGFDLLDSVDHYDIYVYTGGAYD